MQLRSIFPKNINASGRWLRAMIGVGLLIWAYVDRSWLLFAAALFTFFEAFMSWCVLFHLLGKNSCRIKR